MKNIISFLLFFCFITSIDAQQNKYYSLGKDERGNCVSYQIDKTLHNEFYFWLKVEYKKENDLDISKTEFYIHAKCDNKTTGVLKYKNDWRKDDKNDQFYESPKNLVEYAPTLEDNKIYPLFKKYCN